ncbi:MAG TPA: S1 RNA-binding domain-containing protein, partial [Archangium sp.]|nr:S1 RNA-binding domain-containing protein [Archangium sp.]
QKLEDVKEGMVLQGVVTNVTAFGAFVDVGVHQDGLVHVSQLSTRFIKDPSEAVKVGDRLTVKVLSVDLARKRLALSVRAVTEGTSGASVGAPRSSRPEPAPAASKQGSVKQGGGKAPAPAAQKSSAEPFNNPVRNLKR